MTASQSRHLHDGQAFVTFSGRRGHVTGLLGAGGQGEVYGVSLDGQALALKWYHPHYVAVDVALRTRLERAVRRGAPTGDFLWPLDLVDIYGSPSFGYVMPLRGPEYVSIRDLIAPPPRRLNLSLPQRAAICQRLAHSFLELHAGGFCYQDINFGNIFLDPRTARVLICDNDNVNIDGADASIYGTRKFMAPEVVRRETLPNSRTDLFSMAVLFFYTLFSWHPLDGRREAEIPVLDAAAELRLYGEQPLFLFDPRDASNGPVPGIHDALAARWASLPAALRRLFVRAFGEGLNDPAARVLETEWRSALRIVEDGSFACVSCGFEHVAEPGRDAPTTLAACLACETPLAPPPFLRTRSRFVALTPGMLIDDQAVEREAGRTPWARVETHPRRPELLGLRNLSAQSWRATLPQQAEQVVEPGQTLRILPESVIAFGPASGVICDAVQTRSAA